MTKHIHRRTTDLGIGSCDETGGRELLGRKFGAELGGELLEGLLPLKTRDALHAPTTRSARTALTSAAGPHTMRTRSARPPDRLTPYAMRVLLIPGGTGKRGYEASN